MIMRGKMSERVLARSALIAALVLSFASAGGRAAAGAGRSLELPLEIVYKAADDLELFFRDNVPPKDSDKIAVGVAPLADETGDYESARLSFRTDLQDRIMENDRFRLLPSSRFDYLMSKMFPGQKADALSDKQFRAFAQEAPVNYIVLSRIVRDEDGETRLEVRLRNALEGLMLYSPDYVVEKAKAAPVEEEAEDTEGAASSAPAVATSDEESAPEEEAETDSAEEAVTEAGAETESSAELEEAESAVSEAENDTEAGVAEEGQSAGEDEEQVEALAEEAAEAVENEPGAGAGEEEETEAPVEGDESAGVEEPAAPESEEGAEASEPAGGAEPKVPVGAEEKAGEPGAATGTVAVGGLARLPQAVAGRVEYFEGAVPDGQALDIAVFPLDAGGAPGVVVLTTGSMEIFKFAEGGRLESVWSGKFKNRYPRRGLAGRVMAGNIGGRTFIFVTINRFEKSFLYEWKAGRLEKVGYVAGLVVDVLMAPTIHMVSEYGKGVISFSGSKTRLVDTTKEPPREVEFPLKDDYYAGCVRKWSDVSPSLVEAAVVNEDGIVKVYQGPDKVKAESDTRYGGAVACGPDTANGGWLFATTESGTNDAVALLEIADGKLTERWRTPGLGGAVTALASWDFDGDGKVEVTGALESRSGVKLFRLLPEY